MNENELPRLAPWPETVAELRTELDATIRELSETQERLWIAEELLAAVTL